MCLVVNIKMEKRNRSYLVLNRYVIKVQNMLKYYLLLFNYKMCFQGFEF